MKNIYILSIFTLLCCFCVKALAQNNPFLPMAEQSYAEYSYTLNEEFHKFAALRQEDTLEALNVIRQLEEVAHKTGSVEWKLHVAFFMYELKVWKREVSGKERFPVEDLLHILEEAVNANIASVELAARSKIIHYLWYYVKNYEQAFELYAIQEKRLEQVTSEDIPEKAEYIRCIADAYYYFKDYEQAMVYFKKVLEEKDYLANQSPKQHARNGLGLCYCYHYKDLERSDSCFHMILNPQNFILRTDEYHRVVWEGIAAGNLGNNMLLRGAYDQAIPLLKSSLEKMLQSEDYPYSSGIAIKLADIYFKKGNLSEAKRYVDLAFYYHSKTPWAQTSARLYRILSKYHALAGNGRLAMAYIDSTFMATERSTEQFNAVQLLRVKQRQHISEQQLKDEKLHAEILRNKRFHQDFTVLVAFTVLVSGLLVLLFRQFRKRNAAYHALVVKTQQWAHFPVLEEEQPPTAATPPDTVDIDLFKRLNTLMEEEHLYRNRNITLEQMAKMLDIHRNYLSQAINRCAGTNFNIFINEFRVKEAVRIISGINPQNSSIETTAFDVGFNDRQTFYRAFKKFTGLSPAQFRDNLHKGSFS